MTEIDWIGFEALVDREWQVHLPYICITMYVCSMYVCVYDVCMDEWGVDIRLRGFAPSYACL
jgi:hypothetical protein